MKFYLRCIGFVSLVLSIVIAILSIWTGDERWAWTALVSYVTYLVAIIGGME